MANITPTFKRGSKNKKENFRPVSILSVLLNVFEKLMSKQLSTFSENILLKFQMDSKRVIVSNIVYCSSLKLEMETCSL